MEKDKSGSERPAILEYMESCWRVPKKMVMPFPCVVVTWYVNDLAPLCLDLHHL